MVCQTISAAASAEPAGHFDQPIALAHVSRVQPAAISVERQQQRIELGPRRRVRRGDRGLYFAHAIDERLEIVHTAEDGLRAGERHQIGARVAARGGRVEFQRVAQLLQRDAHEVKALGKIDGARLFDGCREPRGSNRDACLDRPSRAGSRCRTPWPFLLSIDELPKDLSQLTGHFSHVIHRQFIGKPLARGLAVPADDQTDASERRSAVTARNMQLVNQEMEDVELANNAELIRNVAEPPVQLPRDIAVELEHGKERSQPPRRHARAMQSPQITGFHAPKGANKAAETRLE